MGYALFYGEGVRRNRAEALPWYRKAARQGNERAMYNIGLMYKNGNGAPKSLRWARFWFKKAAAQGHEKARVTLRELDEEG